jgi:hypothetical protein
VGSLEVGDLEVEVDLHLLLFGVARPGRAPVQGLSLDGDLAGPRQSSARRS